MLVLSRKRGERVVVTIEGKEIVIVIADIIGPRAKIGFEGPREVQIKRAELLEERQRMEVKAK